MHVGKTSSSDSKKYPPGSFMGRLKERKIIATLAAFIGGGWLTYEVVHWVLVDHYHLPERLKDITIVTFLGALFSTLIWRWFRGAEKRLGNVKVEVLAVPLVILITLVIDLKFIFQMTDIPINMLLIGIITLCLGICWIVFKSLQWAAIAPESERKKVEVLKPIEEKLISFPEWKNSIVVLPFENISPEEAQDYFCDGMTDEILTDLSKIHSLRVISRGSAMTLKGSKKKANEIANELDVQYVLEGSVRKAGNNLRITAQLIDATNDAHLWAEKYSGTLDDVFDIQEKVSRSIVDALKLKLSPEEKKRIAERPIADVQAYECYLKSRQEIWRFSEEGLERALQLIKNGLEIVGDNELLYGAMGTAYWMYINAGIKGDEHYLQKAEECARKVFKLNPDSALGYFLRGSIFTNRGKVQEGVKDLKRALEIDPNNSDTLLVLGRVLAGCGKRLAAEPIIKKNIEIDPLIPVNHCMPGYLDVLDGRFESAVGPYRKMYQMDTKSPAGRWFYALVLSYNRCYEEAYAHIDKIAEDTPGTVVAAVSLFLKYALQGKKNEALQSVTQELKATARWTEYISREMAHGYALINEKDDALRWLENAVNHGFINYPYLSKYDIFLENIRGEERFKKLMERVKHEWENFEV
jgi:non-specific serine/threonine protein kinase